MKPGTEPIVCAGTKIAIVWISLYDLLLLHQIKIRFSPVHTIFQVVKVHTVFSVFQYLKLLKSQNLLMCDVSCRVHYSFRNDTCVSSALSGIRSCLIRHGLTQLGYLHHLITFSALGFDKVDTQPPVFIYKHFHTDLFFKQW